MSVLKDYVQLDTRWINIGGVEKPEYPSIIPGHTNTTKEDSYDKPNVMFQGTEIMTFIRTYDTGFADRCLAAQKQADEVSNIEHPVTFDYWGFIENSRIQFKFSFSVGKQRKVTISAVFYDENNNATTLIPDLIYIKGNNAWEKFNDIENKIYLDINRPFTRDGATNFVMWVRNWSNSGLSVKPWYLRKSQAPETVVKNILTYYFWNKPVEIEDNPVGEQEYNGTNQDSAIGHPELPTVSILNGFHNMYQPDLQVINKVNRGLWTTNFFDNVVKLFNNPIESIVSLTLSPIQPPISDNVTPIIVGNLPMTLTTEGSTEAITSRYLTNQYGTYTFGSMVLYQTYKSFLDYNCSVSIYLPYIGVQKLDIDDVMNSTLSLKYNVDFFTGDFVACLQCTKTGGLNSVLYHWKGNILSHIPLSASNFATTYLNGLNTVLSVSQGNTGAIFSNMGNFKPDVSRGGNTSGNVGALDNFDAYIIISKPRETTPDNFKELKGYRSHRKATLSQGAGYIECEEVHVSGTGATDKENEMLEDLLKQGVIL